MTGNPDQRRRHFLRGLGGSMLLPLLGCDRGNFSAKAAGARVAIVGGGFGGTTCAKYLRHYAPDIEITLIAPQPTYLTCPTSNGVLAGLRELSSLTQNYDALRGRYDVRLIHDEVTAIDASRRTLRLGLARPIKYDRLVVAPGIAFRWGEIEGLDEAASLRLPHAWQAGSQTELLRAQLMSMADGGVVAISIPAAPFRCPPGPYERASMVAWYLSRHKPASKILLLDANEQFSKQALFLQAWKDLYPGLIDWVPISQDGAVRRVDAATRTLYTELDEHRVAVANVIPPQRAAAIAVASGLADSSGWCPVHARNFESTLVPGIHVIGDAAKAGPMPRSASAANSQAKVCALAIATELSNQAPPEPSLHNTCYSLVAPDYAISISGIYNVVNDEVTAIAGAGGTSPLDADRQFRRMEATYAEGWYASIVADSFG
jgi:sulfide dehydrogenase [flavocytochrome c] flavoprotein subunit